MPFDTKKLDQFPLLPGVYLMRSSKGQVLYVGKAKNLRQRIKQYFLPGRDGRVMVPFLVAKVEDVEVIVVSSEKEALLLENNLIKQHHPPYNALLKDDKTYIALKVTTKEKWPRVLLVRYKGRPKADGLYFGPYTSATAARETLDLLNRIFPLRQCSNEEFARRSRPCILYQMHRCLGPCAGMCTEEEYALHVARTIKFLKGQDREVVKELYTEMEQASQNLEFEKAGRILKTIRQIEATLEVQHVDRPLGGDFDAIGLFREGEDLVLTQLLFRSGKLVGTEHHEFDQIAQEDEELLSSFLLQHYERDDVFAEGFPKEILLPIRIPQEETIAEILSSRKTEKVRILYPQKGEKRALIEMAYSNAKAAFKQRKDSAAILEKTLLDMQERFHLTRYPSRIECFDNSSHAGSEPVSSLVAFTEGLKDSKRYRTYKLKAVPEEGSDYASMNEVLTRRYKRAKEENDLPDLIIVDGGKGHLNIALKVLSALDISSVDVIGLAKEEGRHDRGMTSEQIFLPNVKDPILLKQTSPILHLLQRIRDEAHRVAISFHRKRRGKRILRSSLDEIPGIGKARRASLLRYFGSVKKMEEATLEEIEKVPGFPKSLAKTCYEQLRAKKSKSS
jgi:excinuclease ABC subunit C